MIIVVTKDSVTMQDPTDFARFHVSAPGLDTATTHDLLAGAGVGRMTDGPALIEIAAIRRLAAGDADWDRGFETMLTYARTKGWLSADSNALQAHVEN
jgi:hypothetical protein